jgi:glucoamylase
MPSAPLPFGSADDVGPLIDWAKRRLLENISPRDGRPGAVIASPSRREPDYYYHWIRDAALVIDVILSLYDRADSPHEKSALRSTLADFVELSRANQAAPAQAGLGEPKYYVNGTVYTGPWGRPQNDGPALRAATLIRFANRLLDEGADAKELSDLYVADLPAESVIKADLEYVSHHWRDPCFDYWEEELATHFATRMAQRRALLNGAALAGRLNDPRAAAWYRQQGACIGAELEAHWDPDAGYIRASIDHAGGIDYKTSGLDTSVVLGALHSEVPGRSFSVTDDHMLATALRLEEEFDGLYPVNLHKGDRPGVAIGRYPQDQYNGYRTDAEGNPWVLTTNAFAEYCYRVAGALKARGEIILSATNLAFYSALLPQHQADTLSVGVKLHAPDHLFDAILTGLCRHGDNFVRRTLAHAAGGPLSEQIHRETGQMTGAPDLTWSYASLISALLRRPDFASFSQT